MKKQFTFRRITFAFVISLLALEGCNKETLKVQDSKLSISNNLAKDAIIPPTFNWETVDWMPTPAGQSQIPPPWIGQGSIASTYGIDIVNDHRASDGWLLLYNTFDPNATAALINPYFVLYNKLTGVMRIYQYITTQFVYPSTYLIDGLSVISSGSTSMLNFLGADVIDPSQNKTAYSQIEPAPTDGSAPLASNKWYMMQYEMAYDPQITNLTSSNTQLSWFTNYNSISTISLGGTETGTIKSVTGAPQSGISSALQKAGSSAEQGAFSLLEQKVLTSNGNATTGDNTLGLSNSVFKDIVGGVAKTLNTLAGGIPGEIYGIFSAIIGGSKSSSPSINANFNSTISLTGTASTKGSLPSSPTSVYIPGTTISPNAQNYIPLSNQPLGVFNLTGKPTIKVHNYYTGSSYNVDYTLNNDDAYTFLTFNPAVINNNPDGATIVYATTEPIVLTPSSLAVVTGTGKIDQVAGRTVLVTTQDLSNTVVGIETADYGTTNWFNPSPATLQLAVRVVLTIQPNSGYTNRTPITIVKTFLANAQVSYN